MSVLSWFDMAGKVAVLTAQLAARTVELRDAHRTVEYWKQIAGQRFDEIRRLNADVNEARASATSRRGHDLLPAPVAVPLGSKDRANALRLEVENARLRARAEDAEAEAAQLRQKYEGNPS